MTQNAKYFCDVVSYDSVGCSQYDGEVVFWNNQNTGVPPIVPESGVPAYSPSLQGLFLRSKIPLSGIDFNALTPDFVLALPNYQNLDNSVSRSAFDYVDALRDNYLHQRDRSTSDQIDPRDRSEDGGYRHVYYSTPGYTTEHSDANHAQVPGSLDPCYKLPEVGLFIPRYNSSTHSCPYEKQDDVNPQIISGFEEHGTVPTDFYSPTSAHVDVHGQNFTYPPIKPGVHFSENVDATPGIAAHHSPHNTTHLFHPAASADTFREIQQPSVEDTCDAPMWSLQAISDPEDWQRYNIFPLRFPRQASNKYH